MQKRIIPCLDIRDGRVVKGKKFKDIQDVAHPLDLAKKYEKAGADVLFLLDISGDNRETFLQIVRDIRAATTIPLYVGGGIRNIDHIGETLDAGATKVSITSAAITNPELLKDAADKYGTEKIILSIDAGKVSDDEWHAFTSGGKNDTGLDVIEWAKQGEKSGVSEILLNSIDTDGVKNGYNLALNKVVTNAVSIPVIASGGAGTIDHFTTVLNGGYAASALAASVFHYEEIDIRDIKESLER